MRVCLQQKIRRNRQPLHGLLSMILSLNFTTLSTVPLSSRADVTSPTVLVCYGMLSIPPGD